MLSPGQVRWAYVAFEDRPGEGKTRPVLILRVLAGTAFVLEGRSKKKDWLRLILLLDNSHPDARSVRLWTDTFFYAENLREIPCDDIGDYIGSLSKLEMERIISELNEL